MTKSNKISACSKQSRSSKKTSAAKGVGNKLQALIQCGAKNAQADIAMAGTAE